MIGISGTNYNTEIKVITGQGDLNMPAVRPLHYLPVPLPHGTGHPTKLNILTQVTESSDYTATAPASLQPPIIGEAIFNRPPIAGKD
jgi:hypothetical protein